MKKVLYVVNNVTFGGVTNILLNTLNKFDYKKYDVSLLVLNMDNYENIKERIPKNVKIISGDKYFNINSYGFKELIKSLDIKNIFKKIFLYLYIKTGLIKLIIRNKRKKILKEKYDCEIAYSDGFATLFTAFGDSPKKLAWIHSDYKICNYSSNYKRRFREALMLHDTVVAVSQEAADSIKEIYNLKKDPKVIINIQNFERLKPLAEEKIKTKFDKNYINLVSVGRLEEQKAYLRYVDIHKKLIEDGYKIRFYLVGDGSEYSLIEDKVKKLNIEDSFVMLGFHSNPFPYVKNADIFVLPSLFEGMPTVVFESLYLKTPVISAKVAGIDYLLGSKKYGIITENSKEGIYEGIKSILDNPKLIDTFRTNLEKYDIDDNKSYNEIYDLINK